MAHRHEAAHDLQRSTDDGAVLPWVPGPRRGSCAGGSTHMGQASSGPVAESERRNPAARAAPAPHDHAPTRDPRTVLGNRSARMLLAQPKLVVGASFDPLEVEADRVAADVVRTMASGPSPDRAHHECEPGCSLHGPGPVAARTISRARDTGAAPI